MSNEQDPLFLPEQVQTFTKEGNLALMTEYAKQANEWKRKIEAETEEVAKWTKRVQLASAQPDAALLEDTESELAKHKRELLNAQMELTTLDDKRAALRYQNNAPSTEQRFRTAQAQAMVAQFKAIGVDPDTIEVEKDIKNLAAEQQLAALKERALAGQAVRNLSNGMQPPQPAQPAPNEDVTPGDLRRGAPLGQELRIKGKLWRRVDAINIGEKAAEEDHKMSCEGTLNRTRVDSTFPNGRRLADDGVTFEGNLSFTVRGLTPNQDILLLLRVDVGQPHEVETLADGALVQTRPLEHDEKDRWRHETVLIPGAQVMMDDMIIARRTKEKTSSNLYGAWLFQAT